MSRVLGVGLVGCGDASRFYLRNAPRFAAFRFVACTDADPDRACARALEFGLEATDVESILARDDVDIVLNLTPPAVHAAVSEAALAAGRHVYSEKPLAVEPGDARRVVAAAARANRRVACAPDTLLGSGYRTALAVVASGGIGTPVAAEAVMLHRGPEHWHPRPAAFYGTGAGPLFDMGPYYVTALVRLLGAVRSVTAAATTRGPRRVPPIEGRAEGSIEPETPTYVAGLLEFAGGTVVTLTTSFDAPAADPSRLVVHGDAGSVVLPDPNTFGGPVLVRRAQDEPWREVPLVPGLVEESRGAGLDDLARALEEDRPHLASAVVGLHVLEVLTAILVSAREQRTVAVEPPTQDLRFVVRDGEGGPALSAAT